MKIGYSHVLHLHGIANDCRTFGTCPADTSQVRGRARRVIPSNRERIRCHVERRRGSTRALLKEAGRGGGKNGCAGWRKRRDGRIPHAMSLAAAVVAPSESFMRLAPIGGAFYSHGALCIFTMRLRLCVGAARRDLWDLHVWYKNPDPPWDRCPSVEERARWTYSV